MPAVLHWARHNGWLTVRETIVFVVSDVVSARVTNRQDTPSGKQAQEERSNNARTFWSSKLPFVSIKNTIPNFRLLTRTTQQQSGGITKNIQSPARRTFTFTTIVNRWFHNTTQTHPLLLLPNEKCLENRCMSIPRVPEKHYHLLFMYAGKTLNT